MQATGDWEVADPRPEALIESLRAFGYSPETAIADLIDNSISAGARNIAVQFNWRGSKSHVAITDDGRGMAEAQLVAAMRPGSASPLEERKASDLGRFGLGLKTASFSQARELSVVSRTAKGQLAARRWNLDVVAETGEWRLLRSAHPEADGYIAKLGNTGTVVLWTNCDRLVGDALVRDSKAHQRFLRTVDNTIFHLSMVFQRFMSGRKKVSISVNGKTLKPWDPFFSDHAATQCLGAEFLPLKGAVVEVKPYVLPHRSKLSREQQDAGAGLGGWNDNQGFYVYRGNRLLVPGSWLGLNFSKDEHTKLARIAINFPAELDHDWQIDVKKSTARPPGTLVEDLRRIASAARQRAEQVYRHRGKMIARRSSKQFVNAWVEGKTRDGSIMYRLNREHPVIAEALKGPAPQRRQVERVFRFVEETVPTTLIGVHIADALENQPRPYARSAKELASLLSFTFSQMVADGSQPQDALELLAAAEPFAGYPEMVQALKETMQ